MLASRWSATEVVLKKQTTDQSREMSHQTAVVSGEASESDDEVDVGLSSAGAAVVSGEDSESEEEDKSLPPLQVDPSRSGDSVMPPISPELPAPVLSPPKFDSLLHKKLRERNASLRTSLRTLLASEYASCGQQLRGISQKMTGSQLTIQDVSHHLRLLTNDLFHFEDKLDAVTSCQILPDIHISWTRRSSKKVTPSSSAPHL